jgi:hypothetical protein
MRALKCGFQFLALFSTRYRFLQAHGFAFRGSGSLPSRIRTTR